MGFKTIASYIRDGGIFVNSGGQSFTYSWDVNTGNSKLLVSFIPLISDVQTNYVDGIPILQVKENLNIPSESLLLKRYFGLETEWDDPTNNMVGPKETEIEFDKILGQGKPRTKANVYRPPVVAVKFGRGFLIHTGMSLDEEREYKILLDIITRLCLIGFEKLAKS